MKIITAVIALTVMTLNGALANEEHAQDKTHTPKIDQRVERQKKRISANAEKGKISQDEAAALNKNVDEVQAGKAAAAADGKITRAERKELHQKLNKNSQAIRKGRRSHKKGS